MATRFSKSLALALMLAAGCTAQAYLNGARVANAGTTATGAVATWDVGMCTETNGNPAGVPPIRYHLVNGAAGPELYERSTDGSGSFVTNRWEDERGTHYYQWVRRTGWEIIITGPGQPGIRNVYLDAQTAEGRPRGAISATCPLTPAAN